MTPHAHYFDCPAADQGMYATEKWIPCWIHLRIDLDGALDLERLERAWKRLPAIHPILGCTLPRPTLRPRWHPDRAEPLDLIVVRGLDPFPPDAPPLAEQVLLNQGADLNVGPPARLAVLEDRDGRQRLLLSVHHASMDARATVAVGETLCELYQQLAVYPDPPLKPDWRPRGLHTVLREVGLTRKQRRKVVRDLRRNDRAVGSSTHREARDGPLKLRPNGRHSYRAWRFGPRELDPVDPIRRERGWTWNDVFLGLLAWGWAEAFGAGTQKRDMSTWLVAADQRPRLGISGGLGNLSGLEAVGLSGVEAADPVAAVAATAAEMRRRKAHHLGLGSHFNLETSTRLSPPLLYASTFRAAARVVLRLLRYSRCFTNIGPVPDTLSDWDGVTATDVLVLAPLPPEPMTIITGNGFGDRINLAVGFAETWLNDDQLAALHRALRGGLAALAAGGSPDGVAPR